MKKILIVSDYFYPSTKGGGILAGISNIYDYFKDQYDLTILTCNHDAGSKHVFDNVPFDVRCNYKDYKIVYASGQFFKSRPFLDFLNSFDGIFCTGVFSKAVRKILFLRAAGKFHKNVCVGPMGSLASGALAKKHFKKAAYLACTNFLGFYRNLSWVFSSQGDAKDSLRAIRSPAQNVFIALELPTYFADVSPKKVKNTSLHFIYLSRIVEKKNLLFAIQVLSKVTNEVFFDIYGNSEDPVYFQKCLDAIKKLPCNIHCQYKGFLPNLSDCRKAFSAHDFFLFPTTSENYGYVILESLSAGTPVIVSDKTYWNFLEKEGAGFVCSLDDRETWLKAIGVAASITDNEYALLSANSIRLYQREVATASKNNGYHQMFDYLCGMNDDKQ